MRSRYAIVAYEASAAPPPSEQDRSITATEVITYAGALVTLAGFGTLLGTQYRQLGMIGRLAIPGLVVVASLVVARALFVGQAQVELLGGPEAAISQDTGFRVATATALL